MTKFTIIGAGLAGLFAGAVLREECEQIIEAQAEIPNNHSALLRFRSSVVGDALNIPFKPVNVVKAVASLGNPVADAVSYSLKTNGSATLRSIISAKGSMEQRFIAPGDFIARLASKVQSPIKFGEPWDGTTILAPIISTLPMPVLARLLNYDVVLPEFKSIVGYTCNAKLRNTDLCATVYIPDKVEKAYRASITGDQLIVEYAFPGATASEAESNMRVLLDHPNEQHSHLHNILQLFGMGSELIAGKPEFKRQPYSKILPIDDDARKRFILWASEKHNVYSFGRFATWRPHLLMDDLVHDLRVIQRLVNGGTSYDTRRK